MALRRHKAFVTSFDQSESDEHRRESRMVDKSLRDKVGVVVGRQRFNANTAEREGRVGEEIRACSLFGLYSTLCDIRELTYNVEFTIDSVLYVLSRYYTILAHT